MFTRARRMACSFCGRKAADVAKLVAGPATYLRPPPYICDECVATATRIMEEADSNPAKVTRFDQPRSE
ncbi:MAG TPA: ClpX C4-type zinc finger protein [Vicinamibacterales bacterium]|jgi:ATP-dependent protease Clp ATPase subunit|nr:ClpX C4-type zinc finger protein [Vicinamibacterales bacterium]